MTAWLGAATSTVSRDILNRETNARFWASTGHRPGKPLDPKNPTDKAMEPVWRDIFRKVQAEAAAGTLVTTYDKPDVAQALAEAQLASTVAEAHVDAAATADPVTTQQHVTAASTAKQVATIKANEAASKQPPTVSPQLVQDAKREAAKTPPPPHAPAADHIAHAQLQNGMLPPEEDPWDSRYVKPPPVAQPSRSPRERPSRDVINKETNARFWLRTKYKPHQKLDPSIPEDFEKGKIWKQILREVEREADAGRLTLTDPALIPPPATSTSTSTSPTPLPRPPVATPPRPPTPPPVQPQPPRPPPQPPRPTSQPPRPTPPPMQPQPPRPQVPTPPMQPQPPRPQPPWQPTWQPPTWQPQPGQPGPVGPRPVPRPGPWQGRPPIDAGPQPGGPTPGGPMPGGPTPGGPTPGGGVPEAPIEASPGGQPSGGTPTGETAPDQQTPDTAKDDGPSTEGAPVEQPKASAGKWIALSILGLVVVGGGGYAIARSRKSATRARSRAPREEADATVRASMRDHATFSSAYRGRS